MKEKILFICMFTMLLLSSCRHKASYDFLYPTEEISRVCIVSVTLDENEEIEVVEQIEIEDIDIFLADFANVSCYTYFGDPIGIHEDGDALKIVYKNDDYELIYWNGQAEYQEDKGFRNYTGYHVFEETEFKELISIYQ